MNILLFGISNVGKTTIGRILAEKLGWDFYDLDDEVKSRLGITLEQFVHTVFKHERDKIRGETIRAILAKPGNKVLAVTPMYYSACFSRYLNRPDVLAIELQDLPEHIFSRLVFSDENDRVYRDDAYRDAHRDYYMRDIQSDISYYKRSFQKITNKYMINNDPPEVAADCLIEAYGLQAESKETV